MTRAQIISAGRSWIGTPYQHQGRSRLGVDCVGLIEAVVREFGIPFEDRVDYNAYGRGFFDMAREFQRWIKPIFREQAGPGDVLLFWTLRPNLATHCGFMTDLGLLHTFARVGRVTEHAMDASWSNRITHAFSLPGVE